MKKYRISPATIIASVALFFSLGVGGAVAAQHYLITSVHQIKPSVRRKLEAPRIRMARAPFVTVASESPVISAAYCPNGYRIVGGGYDQPSPFPPAGQATNIVSNGPLGDNAWAVEIVDTGSDSVTFHAVAICARR